MTHIPLQHEDEQFRRKGLARTLVLRSTHSSQLRVGLFLFCFFFGGASPGVNEFDEASGLVDWSGASSSMVRSAHAPFYFTEWHGNAVRYDEYDDLVDDAWM
jgi:hypothetical protein